MIPGPLTEAELRAEVWPRFFRTLTRPGVYLANHSLGRPLDQMALDVAEFTGLWYSDMDQAWDAWQGELDRFARNVETLIGAQPKTIIHRPSAGQGVRAVLNSFPFDRPIRVVTTTGEFDSLDFILKSYEEAGRCVVDWVEPTGGDVPLFDAGAILERVTEETDLVIVSLVFFGTAQVLRGMDEFVTECRARGTLTLIDVYHAAGAMPLNVQSMGCDFAVGGSYKYLRGGPGASWLYVNPAVNRTTLDTGWFAKSAAMEFGRGDAVARQPGIGGWAESTPPVIATYQARSGLEFALEIGIDRIREYSLQRQGFLRQALRDADVPVFEPEVRTHFGAFSLVPSDHAQIVCARAAERGLSVDARGRMIRLCPDILNTAEEFALAASILAQII